MDHSSFLLCLASFLSILIQVSCYGGSLEFRLVSQSPAMVSICVKEYQYTISTNGSCIYGKTEVTLLPEDEKFVQLSFNGLWPENISLILNAVDGREARVGSLVWRGSVPGGANWVKSESAQNLSVSYRFRCNRNYYGAQCKKTCFPTDNIVGHFTCDAEGNKVCKEGWKGDNCKSPGCLNGCGLGNCSAPGICSCPFGFKGSKCDECIPHNKCVHGSCRDNTPGTCKCHEDWTGHYCERDRYYCNRHSPCLNGGTCSNGRPGPRNSKSEEYTCTCPTGFGGKNCELNLLQHICQNNEICQNGGVCHMSRSNATFCECNPGYAGARCEVPLRSRCTPTSCSNGGSCLATGQSSVSCVCAPCFSGPFCETSDDKCIWNREHQRINQKNSEQSNQTNIILLLAVICFCLLLAVLLLTICWLFGKMRTMMSGPEMENTVNSRRFAQNISSHAPVYKICVSDASLTACDAPPPYQPKYSAIPQELDKESERPRTTRDHRDSRRPGLQAEEIV